MAYVLPARRRAEWLAEWRAELAVRSPRRVLATAFEDALRLRPLGFDGTGMRADARLAFRSLTRRPAFSSLVALTLALGIGANAAIFSVIRGVLLRPLPYEDPGSLAVVTLSFGRAGETRPIAASGPEYLDLRDDDPAFAGVAAYRLEDSNVGGIAEPLRLATASVSWDFLDVLGVTPSFGRGFREEDGRPGAEAVAILSHAFWEQSFAGDPDALGSTVLVNDRPHVIVGVLRADFAFPGAEVALLRNLEFDPADPGGRASHWASLVARLAPGLDERAAQTRTDQAVERWAKTPGDRHMLGDDHPVHVTGLREAIAGDHARPLRLLSVAVTLVLLVACANVAGLLLVRGEDRQHELAVRRALGAGHLGLLRQPLLEAGVLGLAGGALGLLLAWAGVRALPMLSSTALPPGSRIRVDGLVVVLTASMSLLTAVACGAVPAWIAARRARPVGAEHGTRASARRGRVLARRGLVVAEVATAVTLLAMAGVVGRSFAGLLAVDPGFDVDGAVSLDFALSSTAYPRAADVAAFHGELERRVGALPGVVAAGSIRSLPLRGDGGWETIDVPGRAPPAGGEAYGWTLQYQVAGPGIFQALGVPLLRGRAFLPSDDAASPPVAVLNEAGVRALFGDDPALGSGVRVGRFEGNENPVMTVVGVVGDTRQNALNDSEPPQIYVPRSQAGGIYGGMGTRFASLVVRSSRPPESTLAAAHSVLRELDPRLPIAFEQTLREQVRRSLGNRTLVVSVMGSFAAAALLLGAVGLYGLLAYTVTLRTRDIGIRVALGAPSHAAMRPVLGEAAALVALGSALGLAGALLMGRLVEGLLYGVSPRDPLALAAAPALLLVVGLLASYRPARRAAVIDPCEALRSS